MFYCPIVAKQGKIVSKNKAAMHAHNYKLTSEDFLYFRSLGKDIYIFSPPGIHRNHVNVNMASDPLGLHWQPKGQKMAALCLIISCLDDEGEGIQKKGRDRDLLRREQRGFYAFIVT